MSGLKLLRNRIKSVKSTQKITKAMRMVSAAKLHRAKDAASFASIYRQKIKEILSASKSSIDYSELSPLGKSILYSREEYDQTILIINGSDRGLCGAFNSALYRKFRLEYQKYKNIKTIVIGKKISELVAKHVDINLQISAAEDYSEISKKVREFIISEIEVNPSTRVVAYFTIFKNALTQIPCAANLIPVEDKEDGSSSMNVEFEGDNLIEKLTNLYLESNLMANLYESKASEEASRMTAMDNASKNAGEMIERLTLKMNRTRQAQITKELIEVISGAEAV